MEEEIFPNSDKDDEIEISLDKITIFSDFLCR